MGRGGKTITDRTIASQTSTENAYCLTHDIFQRLQFMDSVAGNWALRKKVGGIYMCEMALTNHKRVDDKWILLRCVYGRWGNEESFGLLKDG